jgi:hypothetical protein
MSCMARVIAHHQGADGNGKLRPQGMKHLDGFSDDFGGDFGVILVSVLSATINALKQGRASLKSSWGVVLSFLVKVGPDAI